MVLFSKKAPRNDIAAEALTRLVARFEPEARQALYAASNRRTLRRGTWNGCAMNRAGVELGVSVSSPRGASAVLGIPTDEVKEFISVWDGLRGSDAWCTALLRDTILRVGLFTPSTADPQPGRAAGRDEPVERSQSVTLSTAASTSTRPIR